MKDHVVVNYSLVTGMPEKSLFEGTQSECEAYVNDHSSEVVNSMRIVTFREAQRMFRVRTHTEVSQNNQLLLSCSVLR